MNHSTEPKTPRLQPVYRFVSLLLLVALAPLTMSCYGNFPLTKFIYDFNGDIGDEFTDGTGADLIESIVMWIFVILPVYGLAMLADAVIFNLVEFWTGDAIELTSVTTDDGSTIALAPNEDGSEAVMTLTRNGDVKAQHRFVRISDQLMELRSMKGELLGTMERDGSGTISFKNAEGETMRIRDEDGLVAGATLGA